MFLERLKKKEMLASIPSLICKVLLGIGLILFSGITQVMMGPTPLTHLDPDALEGEYVSYDLWISFDCFAEMVTTTDNDEISQFMDYLVLVEEDYYLAVRVYPSDYQRMQRLTDESYAWMDYETDTLPEVYSISGVIQKIETDELSYFYDYIGLSQTEADAYGYLPLVIDTHAVRADGMDVMTSIVFALLGLASLLWAVWSVHAVISMRHHQAIVSYLKQYPEKEEELEKWLENTDDVHGLRMNEKWCCHVTKKKTQFEMTENILWIYQHITQHRTYGIPTGKSHSLIVGKKEGKFWTLPMRKEEFVVETMDYMVSVNPKIVRGYSKQLEDLFSKDRETFSHLMDEK